MDSMKACMQKKRNILYRLYGYIKRKATCLSYAMSDKPWVRTKGRRDYDNM